MAPHLFLLGTERVGKGCLNDEMRKGKERRNLEVTPKPCSQNCSLMAKNVHLSTVLSPQTNFHSTPTLVSIRHPACSSHFLALQDLLLLSLSSPQYRQMMPSGTLIYDNGPEPNDHTSGLKLRSIPFGDVKLLTRCLRLETGNFISRIPK